jgi:hypothetical protein
LTDKIETTVGRISIGDDEVIPIQERIEGVAEG